MDGICCAFYAYIIKSRENGMQQSSEIRFRHVTRSPNLLKIIQKYVDRLELFFPRIVGCQVLVEAPHHHQKKGFPYHVRVDIQLPGKEIVVDPHPKTGGRETDIYVAVSDSFNAATRKLLNYVKKRRDTPKSERGITAPSPVY